MANLQDVFYTFYQKYDYNKIKEAYDNSYAACLFSDIFDTVPFFGEIRMKGETFAMQLHSNHLVSAELLIIVGYFFEHYNKKKNCVWTKNELNIRRFFNEGILKLKDSGGKVTFNLSDDDKLKIIGLMIGHCVDESLKTKLVDNFFQLETNGWQQFLSLAIQKVEKEKQQKHIEEVTSMDLPLDWNNAFAADEKASGVFAETISDGLILSVNNLGKVDIEYIAQITGEDLKTVICALKGSIYQNPDTWDECFYKGWETADEYLSGKVLDKLKKAQIANKTYNGYFKDNINALKKVLPNGIAYEDVYITLGSPWIPTHVIEAFILHIAGSVYNANVLHDEESGIWKIQNKSSFKNNFSFSDTYGTKSLNGIYILERTLNMKTVFATKEIPSPSAKSGKKKIVDKEETILILEKQKLLINEFKSWIWNDDKRKKELLEIYEERYCSTVIRHFDGSFLTFPEMNQTEELYDYQKNAVARIILSPNTLLAHDVGAGKTYTMIAAGMEMKRIGISNKNLYVVPNNIIGQWRKIFEKLYPKAHISIVEPNTFKPNKRQKVLEDIRDNSYDAIIMAYSCFEMIPLSKEYYYDKLNKQLSKIEKDADTKNKAALSNKRKTDAIEKAMNDLKAAIASEYDVVYFEDLGITTMFVDEAHNFKNIPIKTKIQKVLGISNSGSSKCQDMLNKVQYIQKSNNGRGVVFATGTPITNSLTDAFVMQKYLQSGELVLLGLQSFDSWVGMFAEKETAMEVDVDTNNFRMTERFSKFHNMPELSILLAEIADFYKAEDISDIPKMNGYQDIVVPKTDALKQYLSNISYRADMIRNGMVSPSQDNMLKITADGRKAALDLRLVDKSAGFTYNSKVSYCAETVYETYVKTFAKKSTQLVFCDSSTPKADFNLYDELKSRLIGMGIPEEQIAFIHSATTEDKKDKLFKSVQNGDVRVLIGSTFKLGLGVNVQNKLIALHHLDVPWRPADMAQREGRILRRGNENTEVHIYRYITEGSFDAYSWQLLEIKQRMIRDLLSGCLTGRKCDEISDSVLDYAEVKAISIGNPLLKKRVETANNLAHNLTLQRKLIETKQNLFAEQEALPAKIRYQEKLIENCKSDMEYYLKNKRIYNKHERKQIRQAIYKGLINNELSQNEQKICSYQGFDVILPTNMQKTKPFVYLKRAGKYCVEMGIAETGTLKRIDYFLENINKHLTDLNDRLNDLNMRKLGIKNELEKQEDYTEIIDALRAELKKLDKKLGV